MPATTKNNPYQATNSVSAHLVVGRANRRLWATIGFSLLFLPLFALGVFGLYVDAQYAATLPANAPRCGNSVLGALFLMLVAAPAMGTLGAGIGVLAAAVHNVRSRPGEVTSRDGT
ncbi:MAG TPA: hypothetical protein DDW52_06095 [Planctomycetaceae bacterium]|nr:hypothetical protein [Planctomycetaceae bacterium]